MAAPCPSTSGTPRHYGTANFPVDGSVQRENAGYLAPGQTKLAISGKGSIASGLTFALPTPPAGKHWLITDIFLTHDSTVALEFQIQQGGISILDLPIKGDTAPFYAPNVETQFTIDALNAAQVVIASNAATNAYWWISGIVQDIGNG